MTTRNTFQFLGILVALVFITQSCSKDIEDKDAEKQIVPDKEIPFSSTIDMKSADYFKSLSNLKSTNGYVISQRESISIDIVTGEQTPAWIDYFVYNNNLLESVYRYYSSGGFIGAFYYYYDSQNLLIYSVSYGSDGSFKSYCYNSYQTNGKVKQISYYNNSYQLTSYYTFYWNDTNPHIAYYNTYDPSIGSAFHYLITYNYNSTNQLISSTYSNGKNITYLTDMYGRIYQEKIAENGGENITEYSRPADNTFFTASHFSNGNWYLSEVYSINSAINGNYDETDPLNIFRLNYYYKLSTFGMY